MGQNEHQKKKSNKKQFKQLIKNNMSALGTLYLLGEKRTSPLPTKAERKKQQNKLNWFSRWLKKRSHNRRLKQYLAMANK